MGGNSGMISTGDSIDHAANYACTTLKLSALVCLRNRSSSPCRSSLAGTFESTCR